MKVTVLGTADGHTSAARQHSGLLLQEGTTSLLLDAGANVAQFLFRTKIDPNVPDALWLSHLHSDHVGQFAMLIQSLWLRHRQSLLRIYCPAGAIDSLKHWLEVCVLFPRLIGFPLEWCPIRPAESIPQGAWQLKAFGTSHLAGLAAQFQKTHPQTSFDCFGVAIQHETGRFVYSADLGLPQDLEEILRQPETDFLACEVSHFPSAELFHFLAACPVRKVALTHYSDELAEHPQELIASAKSHGFMGEVILLSEGWVGDV